jgi:translation initiation factor 4E
MDTSAPPLPAPVQTVMLGRDYEVVLPPLMTPRAGSVPLHPLNSRWALWAQKKVKKAAGASWYEGYVCLGRFDTVEGFWQLHSHLLRPEMVQGSADLMLFRDGIRPVWEDEANKGGGKWTLRMKKAGASLVWEELLLNLIGETLDCGSDICGAIISLRFQDSNISLWHRSADSEHFTSRLRCVAPRAAACIRG